MRTWQRRLVFLANLVPAVASAQSINLTQSSIRLYEQDGGFVLGESRRVYTWYFNTLRTRYIGVAVTLEHAAASSAFTLSIGCQMTRPDGTVVPGLFKIGARIAAGSTRTDDANVMFAAGREGWQTGVYKVTCAASRPVGDASFQMSPGPSLLGELELRLKQVQFFPTGARTSPPGQRTYLDNFSSAEATRIGIELGFVQAAAGKRGEVPVDCYYLTPSGNVLGTMTAVYTVEPGAAGGTVAMGMGWDEPGHWDTGDYLAICQIHGRPISVDRFTVR